MVLQWRFLLPVLVLGLAFGARAENLTDNISPASAWRQAKPEERAEFLSRLEAKMLELNYTAEQQTAIRQLVSDNPEATGDTVLAALPDGFQAWFYGASGEEVVKEGLYDVRKQSNAVDMNDCFYGSRLCVIVSKAQQRIFAYLDGKPLDGVFNQRVSTARPGKYTPTGTFSVEEVAGPGRKSGLYNGAFMGYAMQLDGHIFLHATSADNYGKLGSPASAGCVRLHLDVAKRLNETIRSLKAEAGTGLHRAASTDLIRVVVTNQAVVTN